MRHPHYGDGQDAAHWLASAGLGGITFYRRSRERVLALLPERDASGPAARDTVAVAESLSGLSRTITARVLRAVARTALPDADAGVPAQSCSELRTGQSAMRTVPHRTPQDRAALRTAVVPFDTVLACVWDRSADWVGDVPRTGLLGFSGIFVFVTHGHTVEARFAVVRYRLAPLARRHALVRCDHYPVGTTGPERTHTTVSLFTPALPEAGALNREGR
ncbi:hypothetical protein [Streptomyces sp. CC224B]|uniref:hypothetical protein n=1 Tax=Streptomyces sp. CC224B TaxID=3044571 RepID=UPI0024A8F841|nr:hypothetical protein [Streptomyces sp. CC224B]